MADLVLMPDADDELAGGAVVLQPTGPGAERRTARMVVRDEVMIPAFPAAPSGHRATGGVIWQHRDITVWPSLH
jgi:hypothetical protein